MRAMIGTMARSSSAQAASSSATPTSTRRYIWWDLAWFDLDRREHATIVFIAKGIEAEGGSLDVNETMTTLLIGAVVWAYLGILFEFLMETVAWERWEGTIEYTSAAPPRGPCTLPARACSRSSTGSCGRRSCSSSAGSCSSTCPCRTRSSSLRSSCCSSRPSRSSASG